MPKFKNLDKLLQQRQEISTAISEAMRNGDEEAFSKAFTEFQTNLQESVLAEAESIVDQADRQVLAARGVRQLTQEEHAYFQALNEAMRNPAPAQAVTNLELSIPLTTIEAVFEDLQANHPLLEAINFVNSTGLTEILVNASGQELAAWGTLTGDIVKELTGGLKKLSVSMTKLSAFIPVAKAMLDLGPVWLERYVRTLMAEALAFGLEDGIINGSGKDQPVGMIRQVGDGVTVTDGVYPEKVPATVTDFDPVTYGELLGKMAKDPNGRCRVITEALLVCNPVDYLTKIMPATTIRATDGSYVNNVFPFPTRVVQSAMMAEGKAVFGLASKYFMAAGTGKAGKIESDDSYRFLEDERVYLTKFYGNGQPLDNNAFQVLDISGMKPAALTVRVEESTEPTSKDSTASKS